MPRPVYPNDREKRLFIHLDHDLYAALALSAKQGGRSINDEIATRLEDSLNKAPALAGMDEDRIRGIIRDEMTKALRQAGLPDG